MISVQRLADATPATRDRYVDCLRAFSILVVVFGHWLMAVVVVSDGRLEGGNALEMIPGMWVLTWVLQVMPLFFFVGGFSNFQSAASSERSGRDFANYLRSRMARLLTPAAVFVSVWLIVPVILRAFGLSPNLIDLAGRVVGVPLWFLGIYVLAVALAPAMLRLHRRYRAAVLVVLAVGAVAGDLSRIVMDAPYLGLPNFLFVWLFIHQLGFFYADGTFDRWSPKRFALMAVAGLSSLAWLVSLGVYSPSMVGVDDGKVSNNSPPSLCIIALSVWLIGIAMLLRPRITRWLRGRRPWTAVIGVNAVIMTIYLWHLTALVIVAPLLYPAVLPKPPAGSLEWWLLRPLWIGALTACLVPLVAVFGRLEAPKIRPERSLEADDQEVAA